MDLKKDSNKAEELRMKKERKLLELRLQGEEVIDIFEIPRYQFWPYIIAAVITITILLLAIPAGLRFYEKVGNRARPEVYQFMLFILLMAIGIIWAIAFFVASKIKQTFILTNKRLVLTTETLLLSGLVKHSLRKEAKVKDLTHVSSKKFTYPHPILLILGVMGFFISMMLEIYRRLGLLESDITFYLFMALSVLGGMVLIVLSITGYKVVTYVFELRFGKSHGPDSFMGISFNSVPIIWSIKGSNKNAEKLFEKGSVLIWRLSRQET